MIKLSKKVEYGLIALLHMDSVRHRDLVTAKEIAEMYNIPAELMGKVLQSLARAGIAESVQGARGGYRLQRRVERVSLGDVVESLEGPVRITQCCDGSTGCDQLAARNIKNPVQRVQEEVVKYLHSLPLSKFRGDRPMPDLTANFRTQESMP